jgi:hypothetical protein
MVTKEKFIEFITSYQEFEKDVDRFDMAITGKSYPTILYESDWDMAVGKMLDAFLSSHFNEAGVDLVYWWLFEDVDHIITQTVDSDLFNGESEINYDVESIDDLWDYLVRYKNDYFLNE